MASQPFHLLCHLGQQVKLRRQGSDHHVLFDGQPLQGRDHGTDACFQALLAACLHPLLLCLQSNIIVMNFSDGGIVKQQSHNVTNLLLSRCQERQ